MKTTAFKRTVADISGLSKEETKVLCLLIGFYRKSKSGSFATTITTVSEKLGYDRRKVSAIVHKLIDNGYLNVLEEGHQGKATLYEITDRTKSIINVFEAEDKVRKTINGLSDRDRLDYVHSHMPDADEATIMRLTGLSKRALKTLEDCAEDRAIDQSECTIKYLYKEINKLLLSLAKASNNTSTSDLVPFSSSCGTTEKEKYEKEIVTTSSTSSSMHALESAIADLKDCMTTITGEIKMLSAEIRALKHATSNVETRKRTQLYFNLDTDGKLHLGNKMASACSGDYPTPSPCIEVRNASLGTCNDATGEAIPAYSKVNEVLRPERASVEETQAHTHGVKNPNTWNVSASLGACNDASAMSGDPKVSLEGDKEALRIAAYMKSARCGDMTQDELDKVAWCIEDKESPLSKEQKKQMFIALLKHDPSKTALKRVWKIKGQLKEVAERLKAAEKGKADRNDLITLQEILNNPKVRISGKYRKFLTDTASRHEPSMFPKGNPNPEGREREREEAPFGAWRTDDFPAIPTEKRDMMIDDNPMLWIKKGTHLTAMFEELKRLAVQYSASNDKMAVVRQAKGRLMPVMKEYMLKLRDACRVFATMDDAVKAPMAKFKDGSSPERQAWELFKDMKTE